MEVAIQMQRNYVTGNVTEFCSVEFRLKLVANPLIFWSLTINLTLLIYAGYSLVRWLNRLYVMEILKLLML